ncbi:YjfI family protein [Paucibacter sp. O1-1]|nr:YjfI family protein [Paucibacter sp. O1-1]MDA3831324.1 YjfI family protein [Paucibacter sp. O1-1]
METLLDLNPSVPLSAFGRIGGHFVLFGALSPESSPRDVALELATLSDGGRDAISTLSDFLV